MKETAKSYEQIESQGDAIRVLKKLSEVIKQFSNFKI